MVGREEFEDLYVPASSDLEIYSWELPKWHESFLEKLYFITFGSEDDYIERITGRI